MTSATGRPASRGDTAFCIGDVRALRATLGVVADSAAPARATLGSLSRLTTSPETKDRPTVTSAITPGNTAFHISAPIVFMIGASYRKQCRFTSTRIKIPLRRCEGCRTVVVLRQSGLFQDRCWTDSRQKR